MAEDSDILEKQLNTEEEENPGEVVKDIPQDGVTENGVTLPEEAQPQDAAAPEAQLQDATAPEAQPQDAAAPVAAPEKESDEVKEPPKRKRGTRIFLNLFLIVAIAIGILSLFGIVKEIGPDAGTSFGEILQNSSLTWFFIFLAGVLGIMILDSAKFVIISKTVTGKCMLGTSVKTNFLGRYYDAVTPFSTGGQPMQIYYLHSKGVTGGNASAMVLIRYFSSIFCWMFLGAFLMIWGSAHSVLDDIYGATILKVTGWVGIGVNLIIPVFVTLFLAFPKLMQKLVSFIVFIGYKMKLVKDRERAFARATKIVTDFKTSFKHMGTSPLKLILLIFVCLSESFLTFSIPYFAMRVFGCPVDGKLLEIMALNAFATFGVSFIPTPGNSGAVESLGALAFSVAAGAALAWSVLVWRLSVFYIYILIGLGITVRDIIKKNIQARKRVL